ncbi:hypothetical protein MMC29_003631 [Sticta canariensis]|nr:hypothetical protein [Sticta canariensis]
MASLSAAAPFQDVIESNSAKIPSLNDPVSDSNEFFDYSGLTGVGSDAPEVLAFNSGLDSESNLKINSGTPETSTSNSNSDNAIYHLNNPGSSINLDEPISSVLFNPAPLVLAPDLGTPEVDSNTVENPITVDPGISTDNSLIIVQKTDSVCPAPIDNCPNPESYIRPAQNVRPNDDIKYTPGQVEHNDAVEAKDGRYLYDVPNLRWDVDFRKVCKGYSTLWRRVVALCCFGPETAFFGFEEFFVRITNEGNCVTFTPDRPRCADIDDRFCCEGIRRLPMRWGWEGLNCVPAQ